MFFFRRVEGKSMEPTLRAGQIVLVHQLRNFKEGQVVVAFIDGREVVKRISKIDGAKIYLMGDNPRYSTDSRVYGPVSDRMLEGVVFWPKTTLK